MPNGWDALVNELVCKYDADKSAHSKKQVCCIAAIYGKEDGVKYASYPKDFELGEYSHDALQEDMSTMPIWCEEWKCLEAAARGDRKGGSQGCGIRLGEKKFMYVRPSPEVDKGHYFSRQGGGGATIAQTDKCIILGVWDKEAPMSNGELQNTGDAAHVVETMAKFLKKAGW